jgi:hypothetical protein
MDFPERTTKNGTRMARIASGIDGPAVAREAATVALTRLGIDISRLAKDDLVIDVGRRSGGGSFWIVWIKEDLLEGRARMFEDPWNPTPQEIRSWAHTTADPPEQDWELAVSGYPDLLVELVDDPMAEPYARLFLLRALYILVGDVVRARSHLAQRSGLVTADKLEATIADASVRCEPLQRWAGRARALLAGTTAFTYDDWGLGSALANSERRWFEEARS